MLRGEGNDLPPGDVASKSHEDLDRLVVTAEAGQQEWRSTIHVIVVGLVVAGVYQSLNAGHIVFPTTTTSSSVYN